jgi:multidrug resistance efflux pump
MWRDVGLGDWLFEIDPTTGDQIAAKLLALHRNQKATTELVRKAQFRVAERRARMAAAIQLPA